MARVGDEGERELIRDIRSGDRVAMNTLYHRYVGRLAAVCSRYITREDDVKDVLQDSFVKIFTSVGKFEWRGEGSLRGWMARIVVNESLDFLKRNRQTEFVGGEQDIPDEAEEEPDAEGIPPEVLMEMVRRLPPGYRVVFNLYVFERRSHKEIAVLLDIGESTSASQLHRAKAMLAKEIRRYKSQVYGR